MENTEKKTITRAEMIDFLWRAAKTPTEEIGVDSDLAEGMKITIVDGREVRKVTKTVSRLGSAKLLLEMKGWGEPHGTEEDLKNLINALSRK